MPTTLKDKVAIVTGGSGGIGSAICNRLSAEGAAVVMHYSGHEDVAQQVVQRIEANKGKAIAVQADLSQSDRVTALFDRAEQQFGKPDIVVNVAGIRLINAIAETDDDTFDKMFGLNAKGAFFCMREAARRLNNNGRIVNITSGLVVRPPAGYGLYVGSKTAVADNGCKTLVISGFATEAAVIHAVVGAIEAGYRAIVAVDACGGMSERTESAALRQIEAVGGEVTSTVTIATSLEPDLTIDLGQKMFGVLQQLRLA